MARKFSRVFVCGLSVVSLAGLALVATDCFKDEDTSVSIVTECEFPKLDPSISSEITVKLYNDTATELLTRAQALEAKFKDVCNAINRDLGLSEGSDIRAACNSVAKRMAAAQAMAPIPDGGGLAPVWVLVRLDERLTACKPDTQAEANCRNQCHDEAGACDPIAQCQASANGALVGTCGASCEGNCRAGGDKVPCAGECRGNCDQPGGGAEAGTPACTGECSGTCANPVWSGRCDTGCAAGFIGSCLGQCNGTCDGQPVGTQPVDAGGVDAGGDAGEGGVEAGVEAGVDAGAPAAGNCVGTCVGKCTAKASGSCTAKCAGNFSGGVCPGAGNCKTSCLSASTPCTTTCTGFCVSTSTGTCAGTCEGTCSAPVTNPLCEGALGCASNEECGRVCRVRGALAAKCAPPPPPEVRVAGDYALYDALRAHIVDFVTLTREMTLLRDASDGIIQRTSGDFRAIGVRSDNARKCAEATAPIVVSARASLDNSFNAAAVLKGTSF
jgi:hypothetical protein